MQDARVRIALLVICAACLLGSGVVLVRGRQQSPEPVVLTAAPVEVAAPVAAAAPPAAPKHPARIYVDVAGAVRRPSLYILPPESRIMQAVLAAGGPVADADLDSVNLAQKVTDGEKVFVPTRAAASPAAPPAAPPTPATPVAAAPAKGSKSGGSRSGKIAPDSGEQVGLNSATAEELERLPGVGPSMAARILAYRRQAGGFGKIEDLTQVTGIGPKKFAKIAPFVNLD